MTALTPVLPANPANNGHDNGAKKEFTDADMARILGKEHALEWKALARKLDRVQEREFIVCMRQVPDENEGEVVFTTGDLCALLYCDVGIALQI